MESGRLQEPSQQPPHSYYVEEDEMTLRDIILLVKSYLNEIKRNWKLLLLFILPITAVLFYQAYSVKVVYPARMTFMVTEEKGQDVSSIGGLLGSLGVGGGAQNESSLEKVLQLFRSRRIIEETFFERITIEGASDYIANFFIEVYGLSDLLAPSKPLLPFSENDWSERMEEIDFRFTHPNIDSFNLDEKLMLKVLYGRLVGNADGGVEPLVGSTIDEKSGIMSITLETVSEPLTAEMLLKLYDQLSQYYIDKTIEKQLKIYEIAKFKTDSINNQLLIADRKLAEFEDRSRNLVWVRGELERTKLQRQTRILEILYGESIKQLELSDFALRRKTPYVEIIDKPSRPIGAQGKSKILAIAFGVAIGTVLAILFIVFRKIVRDALAEEKT